MVVASESKKRDAAMKRDLSRLEMNPMVREANAVFEAARAKIARSLEAGQPDGLEIGSRLTAVTDDWIQAVWAKAAPDFPDARLFALGGYGRSEMSFSSDVDVVVEVESEVFDSPELRLAVERFIAWCRETRVRVSHAVRPRDVVVQEFGLDIRTAVSYLDARALGSAKDNEFSALAAEFLAGEDSGIGFVQQLIEGFRVRHARFGKTIYRLEPELKNGPGGLRDLHSIRWAARVRWGFDVVEATSDAAGWDEDLRADYRDASAWLLMLRHHLHLSRNRKHDRLGFPDQEALAARLGYDTNGARNGVETLMRAHYQHARLASRAAERMLRAWGQREVPFEREGSFRIGSAQIGLATNSLDDGDIFGALELASDRSLLLEPGLEAAIEHAVEPWREELPVDPELFERLRGLLTGTNVSTRTSTRLLDLGILTGLIPEFEPLVCHVHHDVYHVYTTDVHSVRCLEAGRNTLRGEGESPCSKASMFGVIANEIDDQEVLLLACLFHDIGKNRGGNHSEIGAELMEEIGPRLGLSRSQVDLLKMLVREHLTLSRVSRRRDIGDVRLIREIAGRLETTEALNQLTVLTACDMFTVGDDVLTDWNASLLLSLHARLADAIAHGPDEHLRLQAEFSEKESELVECVGESADPAEIRAFLDDVSDSHVLKVSVQTLARQFEAHRESRGTQEPVILVTPSDETGSTEVVVATEDLPGTLARITGVISSLGLNILSAQILTTASGRTLDVFQVATSGGAHNALSSASQSPLRDDRRIERLKERLVKVLKHETTVEELLRRRIQEKRLMTRPTPRVDTSVKVIEGVSEAYTVIEVKAPDRIGLLYDIASTLQEQNLNVHLSIVDSLGTQVIDTFYVEDLAGGPLTSPRLDEVLEVLARALEESSLRSDEEGSPSTS